MVEEPWAPCFLCRGWENSKTQGRPDHLLSCLSRWAWDSPTELPKVQRGAGPGARMSLCPRSRQAQRGFVVGSEGAPSRGHAHR